MKFKWMLVMFCLALLAIGCSNKEGFEVAGTVQGHAKALIYLDKVQPAHNQPIDSMFTDGEGAFEFRIIGQPEGLYSLRLPNHQSMVIYACKDPVSVEADAGQFASGNPIGNKGTTIISAFNKERNQLRNDFVKQMRTLSSISRDFQPEIWSPQEMKADKASEAYRDYVAAFADTVSLPEIGHYAVNCLNIKGDFYHMQRYVEQQRAKKVESPYINYIERNILTEGDYFLRYEAQDFKLPTMTGDSVSLSSLRGKVVYFFVWASYCGMSRMENQRLAAWYDAHPDSGIEILSYSVDVDEKAWRKAIADDSLQWKTQMLGTNEWTGIEIKQFGITSIPTSFVLDAKGIIRTKGMHASELAKDYAEIVQKWGPH